MTIKITVERIKMYRVTDLSALTKDELPNEYVSGVPSVSMSPNGNSLAVVYSVGKDSHEYHVMSSGETYTDEELKDLWKHIVASGERLHQINHKNDKKDKPKSPNNDWSGSFTFEV